MRSTFRGNTYTLTPVAGTGERFSDFAPYVGAIDNRGLVAFQAALAEGGSGVYLSDGETRPGRSPASTGCRSSQETARSSSARTSRAAERASTWVTVRR